MIVRKEKAFTLIELVIAMLLSAIIVFFAYTMMVTSYKLFAGLYNTSYNLNNIRFFEEAIKKSITESEEITPLPVAGNRANNTNELRFRRYDLNLKDWVWDTYYLANGSQFRSAYTGSGADNDYDTYPKNIGNTLLFEPTDLKVKVEYDSGQSIDILLLKNVRAVYYRYDKTDRPNNINGDLKDVTIGIVYDDDSSKGSKKQSRTFCFTSRMVH